MRRKNAHITPRQRLSAWILLAIYVPMVLLSAMHTHQTRIVTALPDCELCATDEHHSGHISDTPVRHGECLSCRFLATQAIMPQPDAVDCPTHFSLLRSDSAPGIPDVAAHERPTLRAPPTIL